MKKLVLCALVILLAGCATAEVPARVSNTYEVAGSVYCDTPILSNIEDMLVRWIQATISPTWEPVCEAREAAEAED